MTKSELSTALAALSVEELSAHIAEAQSILDQKRDHARREFIEETRKKADALGISLKDILADGASVSPKGRKKKADTPEGRKVAVKYRDPENVENTWTGRGMTPRWLREKTEAGAKLEDFLVEPAA